MMKVRALPPPSKLKLLLPSSHFTYTYTKHVSAPLPLIFETQTHPYPQNPSKTLPNPSQLFLRPFSSQPKPSKTPTLPFNRDGNYDESTSFQSLFHICPGCGVPMQNSDPKQPGFFITPSPKNPDYKFPINRNPVAEELEISNSLKRGILNELVEHEKNPNENPSANSSFLEKPVVCTRCHCLRHYGKVKDPMVENLLPDFDFDHTVGRKLNSTTGARAVVLMVVDAVDFDGSFPKKAGHSVHIGGLMRLDIEELSADSIYITVWASPYLPLHMGKTENVQKMLEDHFGRQLQPPIGEKRSEELGLWVRKEFRVSGNFWDASSVDIAVAGLGWFAIGLKGEASLGVWTYDGINVILCNSLIPDRAQNFEVAGFTVLKIVSKADQTSNKLQRQSGKKHKRSDLKAEAGLTPITRNHIG